MTREVVKKRRLHPGRRRQPRRPPGQARQRGDERDLDDEPARGDGIEHAPADEPR
jgi:hypothetical protein